MARLRVSVRISRRSRPLALLAALSPGLAQAAPGAARARLIRGVSYGPVPVKTVEAGASLPEDDWFCSEAVQLWGRGGRGDLRVISSLGANFVRLYGNNPNNDHTNFLDEALSLGLSVAAGVSDFPYYQQGSNSCKASTDYNCFTQVKPSYLQNLQNGFLTPDGRYHPALKYMNILNEPDLKMPDGATTQSPEHPIRMIRAIISGFDAMLEAEKEAGVVGPRINVTATFSYAVCLMCERFATRPALGQIAALDDGMRHPHKYGYTPKNDITAAYLARFTHSFNTANPATDLKPQFLDTYSETFPSIPVYIGEYHSVMVDQALDLETIMKIAEVHPLFLGISYFEFQQAYWKGGSEEDFGMFGFGGKVLANMSYFGKDYKVWCLKPRHDEPTGGALSSAVAGVYGGESLDAARLCQPNPWAVPLTQDGFAEIKAEKSAAQMASLIERVANHMGAVVSGAGDPSPLEKLAKACIEDRSYSFHKLASYLGGRPAFVTFDPKAKCVARREASPVAIGPAVDWACHHAKSFSCDSFPPECNTTYRIADYVFSRYYEELGPKASPLEHCDFNGAAMFAPSEVYGAWTGSTACVPDSAALATTTGGALHGGGGNTVGGGNAVGGGNTVGGTSAGPGTSVRAQDIAGQSTEKPFDLPYTSAAASPASAAALALAAWLMRP